MGEDNATSADSEWRKKFRVQRSKYIENGVIASACYAGAFVLFVIIGEPKFTELRINEVGDFLAGLFAPLALIWFLVTLFLQSIEISQNSEAIDRQIQEMRANIEEARQQAKALAQTEVVQRQQFLLDLAKTYTRDLSIPLSEILRGLDYMNNEAIRKSWEKHSSGETDIFFRTLELRISNVNTPIQDAVHQLGEKNDRVRDKVLRNMKSFRALYLVMIGKMESLGEDARVIEFLTEGSIGKANEFVSGVIEHFENREGNN